MALSIKNPDVERVTRQLSLLTGETITATVGRVAREGLDRVERHAGRRRGDLTRFLETELWPLVPPEQLDCPAPTEAQRQRILCADERGVLALDSSTIVAVVLRRAGYADLVAAMEGAGALAIGAPARAEATEALVGRLGVIGRALASRFAEQCGVVVIPFGDRHRSLAEDALLRYGRGRHLADLDRGRCMTYATARILGAPLLTAERDFAKTDLVLA